MSEPDLITKDDYARVADVSPRTIDRWAKRGIGPQPRRLGPRLLRYNRAEVLAYVGGSGASPLALGDAVFEAGTVAGGQILDGIKRKLESRAATSTRLPHVVIRNADELRLASGDTTVVTGGPDSTLLIDGIKYAISNEDPVVIRPHGPGIDGGTITLTLICGSILGENEPEQEAPDA
ncbi:helix-turn-helix transcriptional regulator [Streptomyces rubiginosohelvolus]|uniref:helix-turn-helix transcriptional regulator n=1 Tax=Streptomyces rubiginosohelvolus TaxID=67362 RepID=UPI0037ACF1F1